MVAYKTTVTKDPLAPCYTDHIPLLHKSLVMPAYVFVAQLYSFIENPTVSMLNNCAT